MVNLKLELAGHTRFLCLATLSFQVGWLFGTPLCAYVVVVVVFFTLTDRASTLPSNITRGCQSGTTWSAGQKTTRGTFTKKLQREQKKNTNKNNKEKRTRITKYTCQKKIDEGHSIERIWHSASREPHPIPSPDRNHAPKRVASTTFRTLRVSVFTNGTIDGA